MKVQTVRRLVTGHDENGKSRIIMDGPAESVGTGFSPPTSAKPVWKSKSP